MHKQKQLFENLFLFVFWRSLITIIQNEMYKNFSNRAYKLQRCDTYDKHHLLMPGDLIEYVRGPFSHWAVYLGNNQIVHLPGPSNLFANFQVRHGFSISIQLIDLKQICQSIWTLISGRSIEPMKIEIRDFTGLLTSSIVYINNSKDSIVHPLATNEILQRARRSVGSIGYDLVFNNCEHFAHWCRLDITFFCFLLCIRKK